MATTISLASDFTNGKYTADGVACTNNYVVIPITWTDLNGYPEIVVETAVENVDASYHPAMVVEGHGVTTPVKLRLSIEDGNDLLSVDSIYGDTPYARIVVYAGKATAGSIIFEQNVG